MSNILSNCPLDNRHFSAEIATKLGDINAAVIIQQLHYWLQKNVGVIIDGIRWIYNSFEAWVREQFKWLSVWQFRQSMSLLRSLGIVKVIRYKAKQWNQTNYYSLDYDRLHEFLGTESSSKEEVKNAETIENIDLCKNTAQDEGNLTLEMRTAHKSIYESNKTSLYRFYKLRLHLENNLLSRSLTMSGVVKIEINESAETLKKLLKNASTPQEKERIQTIYWLKTKTVETVKQIAIMLGRNRITVQKWLRKYRTGGINLLLEPKKNLGGRPTSIPPDVIEKLKKELQNPEGFQSYGEIQIWLKTCFELDVGYHTVHQLVRYKLKAKLKVPRPSILFV